MKCAYLMTFLWCNIVIGAVAITESAAPVALPSFLQVIFIKAAHEKIRYNIISFRDKRTTIVGILSGVIAQDVETCGQKLCAALQDNPSLFEHRRGKIIYGYDCEAELFDESLLSEVGYSIAFIDAPLEHPIIITPYAQHGVTRRILGDAGKMLTMPELQKEIAQNYKNQYTHDAPALLIDTQEAQLNGEHLSHVCC